MTQQTPPPPTPPNEPLQFDRAEYTTPAGVQPCASCGRPPVGSYFAVNNQVVCGDCRDRIVAATTGGSGAVRLARAAMFGLAAAIAGGVLWYAVCELTGYRIGLIAVVVGVMVGLAVRKGAEYRGGPAYQILAVLLTYACITSQYVPMLYEGVRDRAESDAATDVRASTPTTAPATTQEAEAATVAVTDLSSDSANATAVDDGGAGDRQRFDDLGWGRKALLVLFLFAFALKIPFLSGLENIIGLLILGFALWEAWKLNKARSLAITGPHPLAPQLPPAPSFGGDDERR